MPMQTRVIGKDSEGNDVVEVWGDDLNWAHGFSESRGERREYYRAKGRGNAHYVVVHDTDPHVFHYWYVAMHIDGEQTNLPTEFMSAYEGQEVCQIFEAERARDISKNAHVRVEDKTNE